MNDKNTLYFNLLCVCTTCIQGTLDPLELKLLAAVSSLMRMLETEPGSSTRAESALSHWAISPGEGWTQVCPHVLDSCPLPQALNLASCVTLRHTVCCPGISQAQS